MLPKFAEFVREKRPKAFVIENGELHFRPGINTQYGHLICAIGALREASAFNKIGFISQPLAAMKKK